MSNYLLDTNAVIALMRAESGLTQLLGEADSVYLSVIVLGELYYGAAKSSRRQHNLQNIYQIERQYEVLDCDARTARIYGDVSNQLRQIGKPASPNDVWIAATAMQYGLSLLTKDHDFQNITNLNIQDW